MVTEIEQRVERETGRPLPPVPHQALLLRRDVHSWFGAGTRALFTQYRSRAVLGIALMAAQAFCYNAVFFTYALILTQFYAIPSGDIGWFMLPFAAGNFLGPAGAGPAVRHARATSDDHGDLRDLRRHDGADRLAVHARRAGRNAADDGLDRDLLRRLRRGKFRLSHRRRKLSARDARDRHRAVLCVRHRRRRRGRARRCSAC